MTKTPESLATGDKIAIGWTTGTTEYTVVKAGPKTLTLRDGRGQDWRFYRAQFAQFQWEVVA